MHEHVGLPRQGAQQVGGRADVDAVPLPAVRQHVRPARADLAHRRDRDVPRADHSARATPAAALSRVDGGRPAYRDSGVPGLDASEQQRPVVLVRPEQLRDAAPVPHAQRDGLVACLVVRERHLEHDGPPVRQRAGCAPRRRTVGERPSSRRLQRCTARSTRRGSRRDPVAARGRAPHPGTQDRGHHQSCHRRLPSQPPVSGPLRLPGEPGTRARPPPCARGILVCDPAGTEAEAGGHGVSAGDPQGLNPWVDARGDEPYPPLLPHPRAPVDQRVVRFLGPRRACAARSAARRPARPGDDRRWRSCSVASGG